MGAREVRFRRDAIPGRSGSPTGSVEDDDTALSFNVHERWQIPREMLMEGSPYSLLSRRSGRLLVEWLAKRYIRAAFPTSFDQRRHRRAKAWRKLLARYSDWIQGVYVRLDTLAELPPATPYRCSVLLAVPHECRGQRGWAETRENIEREFTGFWHRLEPGITCEAVDVLPTDRITLADIECYQRFDADWISFEDDTPVVPISVDIRS